MMWRVFLWCLKQNTLQASALWADLSRANDRMEELLRRLTVLSSTQTASYSQAIASFSSTVKVVSFCDFLFGGCFFERRKTAQDAKDDNNETSAVLRECQDNFQVAISIVVLISWS